MPLTNSKICTSSFIQLQTANIVAIHNLYRCLHFTFACAKLTTSSRIRAAAAPTAKLHSLIPPPSRILPQQRHLLAAVLGEPAVRCHTGKQLQVNNPEVETERHDAKDANKMSDFDFPPEVGWFVVILQPAALTQELANCALRLDFRVDVIIALFIKRRCCHLVANT